MSPNLALRSDFSGNSFLHFDQFPDFEFLRVSDFAIWGKFAYTLRPVFWVLGFRFCDFGAHVYNFISFLSFEFFAIFGFLESSFLHSDQFSELGLVFASFGEVHIYNFHQFGGRSFDSASLRFHGNPMHILKYVFLF